MPYVAWFKMMFEALGVTEAMTRQEQYGGAKMLAPLQKGLWGGSADKRNRNGGVQWSLVKTGMRYICEIPHEHR